MFLQNLSVSGLLSFGPEGIDLPLESLNVFIGPNGSGKSNFLDALSLLRAIPNSLAVPMRRAGGASEWFWKGMPVPSARITVDIVGTAVEPKIKHELTFTYSGGRLEILEEHIHALTTTVGGSREYRYHVGGGELSESETSGKPLVKPQSSIQTNESVLSQKKDPEMLKDFDFLQRNYSNIRLFRDWQFGSNAEIRKAAATDSPNDFLLDDASNLDLVLSTFGGSNRRELLSELQELYPGIDDFSTKTGNNEIMLYLVEENGRQISKTRLSDGTLRFICLLSILLHPSPPPVVAIEEPELGLHPDILPQLGRLIKAASERMQLFVTTHSQILLDAFSNDPGDVVVCSRSEDGSEFDRLDVDKLASWLEHHTLGELWNLGEIGGTRW